MILPLISATLKSFLRSRRTLLILFVLPLLLISLIFLSFNADGLRTVPAGIVLNSGLELSEAIELFDMLRLTEFADADTCIEQVRGHDSYLCLNVSGSEQVTVELFYDNTREPVIWEVINLIEYKMQVIQRERSAQAAESLFSSLDSFDEYLDTVAQASEDGHAQLVGYEEEVLVLRNDLRFSRVELSNSLIAMEGDIEQGRSDIRDARRTRNDAVSDMRERIDRVESYADALADMTPNTTSLELELRSEIADVRRDLDDFERDSERDFDSFEDSLDQSELRVVQGQASVDEMSENEARLAVVATELESSQSDFSELRSTTLEFDGAIAETIETGSDPIVDSVRMATQPTYVPQDTGSGDRGFNLLTYQAMFPSLLMLVSLFFGLLLSTFMTLTYVSTPAYVRLRLVQGSWFSDFVAMFVSSVLVASVSVGLVFGLGVALFQIPTAGIGSYALMLFAILSVLTLVGIAIVHIIWSESMSIIVAMFALVGMLFSSGFILPIERMSTWAVQLANVNPITIGLESFDRVVFYEAPVAASDMITLLVWFSGLVFAVLIVRLLREQ